MSTRDDADAVGDYRLRADMDKWLTVHGGGGLPAEWGLLVAKIRWVQNKTNGPSNHDAHDTCAQRHWNGRIGRVSASIGVDPLKYRRLSRPVKGALASVGEIYRW